MTSSHDDAALLTYMRTVYHEPGLSREQMAPRLPSVRWWYHSAPLDVDCRQDAFFPDGKFESASFLRSFCNRSLAAIFLRPPMVTAAMSEHGYWGLTHELCSPRRGGQTSSPSLQHFEADGAWVEVLRIATTSCTSAERRCEGGRAGCWFAKAVGSGIFLNLGRSLRAYSRRELARALKLNASETFGFFLRSQRDMQPYERLPLGETEHLLHDYHLARLRTHPPSPRLSARELARGQRLFAANEKVLDYAVCEFARRANYDTVQLWDLKCGRKPCFPEVVSCHAGCADAPPGSIRGGCVPAAVPLRTGWWGTQPCRCDATDPVLNCQPSIGGPGEGSPTGASRGRNATSFFRLPTCVARGHARRGGPRRRHGMQ